MSKVIVIGSGFGGLAAAIRLAAQGHQVELFEKRDKLGGRAYQYEINGFKFDGGPTVLTAPWMFDELFELVGRKREDYVQFVSLNPFYRIFNHEGKHFDYYRDTEDALKEIERWSPGDQSGFKQFVAHTKKIFDQFTPLTMQPFLHLTDMFKIMPDMIRLQAFISTYSFVSKFLKNEFLRRVFSFHPLLVGGNPFDTPAIYTLVIQFEKQWGVHYALGGTGALVDALGRLFREIGGKVHLNAEVNEILVEGRKATGICLKDGTVHKADLVVSNADPAFTYKYLIPAAERKQYTDERIDQIKYSMSLFVIYFGTKKQYRHDSNLRHHNIILNERYRDLLKEIFGADVGLPDDFSLYLHMPSMTDPSVAPEGHESFYVLSPVPTLDAGVDWETMAEPYKERILQFLEENYLPELRENIVAEYYIDPLHFQNVLNSYKGAAFSVRPTLLQAGWLRPHNRSEEFENLYFVGAGTHPGAGVPAVLASGKITADLIAEEMEKMRQTVPSSMPAEAVAA